MSELWILGGQSNMEGAGRLTDCETPDPRVSVFSHSNNWEVAEEPIHRRILSDHRVYWRWESGEDEVRLARQKPVSSLGSAGCGLTFAKNVSNAVGHDIDLVPCALGGTSMQEWDPKIGTDPDVSLYAALLHRTRRALETKPVSSLKGLLWYQGESDCGGAESIDYQERTVELFSALRRDLDMFDFPILLVQLAPVVQSPAPNSDGPASWARVREAQRTLPAQLHKVYVTSAIDLDLRDHIHVSTGGLKTLGRRLARIATDAVYGGCKVEAIDIDWIDRKAEYIEVRFKNVNGGLRAVDLRGRVPGFGLVTEQGYSSTAFYHAEISATNAKSVLLHYSNPISQNDRLTYGYGYDPFCQLTDEDDRPVPAFGPLALA